MASILRLRVLYVSTTSTDLTWDKAPTVNWSEIEANVGILCTNVATLRPLAARLFPGLLATRHNRTAYYGGGTGRKSARQTITATRTVTVNRRKQADCEGLEAPCGTSTYVELGSTKGSVKDS